MDMSKTRPRDMDNVHNYGQVHNARSWMLASMRGPAVLRARAIHVQSVRKPCAMQGGRITL